MNRMLLTLLAALMACSSFLADAPVATAAPGPQVETKSGKIDPIALRQLLTKGLKATREDQKDYINHIVSLVAQKKLPLSLVYAAFEYSRKRRPDYPFPYFVYSIRTLAKRNNIVI